MLIVRVLVHHESSGVRDSVGKVWLQLLLLLEGLNPGARQT